MKRRKMSIKKFKLKKIDFQSSVNIYKEKFSDKKMIFKPKFSVTKNITFSSQTKIANKLAKAFQRLKPLKFY